MPDTYVLLSILFKAFAKCILFELVLNFVRCQLEELWVCIGVSSNVRYIPTHSIAEELGPDRCMALPMFHAYSGCDQSGTVQVPVTPYFDYTPSLSVHSPHSRHSILLIIYRHTVCTVHIPVTPYIDHLQSHSIICKLTIVAH